MLHYETNINRYNIVETCVNIMETHVYVVHLLLHICVIDWCDFIAM